MTVAIVSRSRVIRNTAQLLRVFRTHSVLRSYIYLILIPNTQGPSRRRRALSCGRAFVGARGKERRSRVSQCVTRTLLRTDVFDEDYGEDREDDDDDRRPLRSFASGTRSVRVVSRANACVQVQLCTPRGSTRTRMFRYFEPRTGLGRRLCHRRLSQWFLRRG